MCAPRSDHTREIKPLLKKKKGALPDDWEPLQLQEQPLKGQQRDATAALLQGATSPSVSLFLFPLLNYCSKPRTLMFVLFNSQKVLRPGSQQTPLCSWKRQLLFSETLGPSLWLPPHLPFRSIMLSGREGWWWGDSAAVASREPMGAQDSFPVISPPSKQNPACLWHIFELWKVM